MARRIFSREFKVEAVRLVKERGVTVAHFDASAAALFPVFKLIKALNERRQLNA